MLLSSLGLFYKLYPWQYLPKKPKTTLLECNALSFGQFWFGSVLCAIAASIFGILEFQKTGPRIRCFLYFNFQFVSRHDSVYFFPFNWFTLQPPANFAPPNFQNCVRNQVILLILILKCVMCHSRVQFLSSRNGSANNICFVYFGFVLRCENKSWLAVQKVLRGRRALRGASGLNKQ